MWSLGCVFLEIYSTLSGRSTTELYSHMMAHGTKSNAYHANMDAVIVWTESLGENISDEPRIPLNWIQGLLETAPDQRFSSETLYKHIAKAIHDPTISLSFTGRCCTEDEESEEEVWSSEDNDITRNRRSTATPKARSRASRVPNEIDPVLSLPGPSSLFLPGLPRDALLAPANAGHFQRDIVTSSPFPSVAATAGESDLLKYTISSGEPGTFEQSLSLRRATSISSAEEPTIGSGPDIDMSAYMSQLATLHPALGIQAVQDTYYPHGRQIPTSLDAAQQGRLEDRVLIGSDGPRDFPASHELQSQRSGHVFIQHRSNSISLLHDDAPHTAVRGRSQKLLPATSRGKDAPSPTVPLRQQHLSRSFSAPLDSGNKYPDNETKESLRANFGSNATGLELSSSRHDSLALSRPSSNLHFEATSMNEFICRLYRLNIDLWEAGPLKPLLDAQKSFQALLDAITPMTAQRFNDQSVYFRHVLELKIGVLPSEAFAALAKALDHLGFVYEIGKHGFSCSYPRKVADEIHTRVTAHPISTPTTKAQLSEFLLEKDTLARRLMFERLNTVLDDWSTHLYKVMPMRNGASSQKTSKLFSKVRRFFVPSVLFHDSALRLDIELVKPSTQLRTLEKVVTGELASNTFKKRKESMPKPWKVVFASGHSDPDACDRFLTRAIASLLPLTVYDNGGDLKYEVRLERLWNELREIGNVEFSDASAIKLIKYQPSNPTMTGNA